MAAETSEDTKETMATINEAIERRNVIQSKSDGGVAWIIWLLPLVLSHYREPEGRAKDES